QPRRHGAVERLGLRVLDDARLPRLRESIADGVARARERTGHRLHERLVARPPRAGVVAEQPPLPTRLLDELGEVAPEPAAAVGAGTGEDVGIGAWRR